MNDGENQVEPKEDKNSMGEMLRYAVIALLIVVPFRIFVAQPYIVSGSSMDPTFKDGDYLIVDQLSKRFEEPQREAVVIIRYPKDPSKFFIKRLIAYPGERVEIRNGEVTVYTDKSDSSISINNSYIKFPKKENFSFSLKDNEYFVMGDNRAGSSDSRVWGAVPKEYIIGEPIVRLLPINHAGLWPGVFTE